MWVKPESIRMLVRHYSVVYEFSMTFGWKCSSFCMLCVNMHKVDGTSWWECQLNGPALTLMAFGRNALMLSLSIPSIAMIKGNTLMVLSHPTPSTYMLMYGNVLILCFISGRFVCLDGCHKTKSATIFLNQCHLEYLNHFSKVTSYVTVWEK